MLRLQCSALLRGGAAAATAAAAAAAWQHLFGYVGLVAFHKTGGPLHHALLYLDVERAAAGGGHGCNYSKRSDGQLIKTPSLRRYSTATQRATLPTQITNPTSRISHLRADATSSRKPGVGRGSTTVTCSGMVGVRGGQRRQ